MTRCEDVQPRLSEYVDGTLDEERSAVVAHLETCVDCQGLADDLARVSATGRDLGPMVPPDHVWLEIAGRIHLDDGHASAPRQPAHRRPTTQWLGLAAALVVVTLGAWWMSSLASNVDITHEGNATATTSVESVAAELDLAMEHYQNAISQLEVIAASGDARLDATTAAMLRDNIVVIDEAIAESRSALTSDPTNQPARASLLEALSQKVNVLQTTVMLMNEMRQGDPAGAAAAAARLGNKS